MKFINLLARRSRASVRVLAIWIASALLIGLTAPVATATTTTLATAASSCSSTTLKQGARGSCVKELQTALNKAGHSAGSVDGSFGPKTRSAVIGFQKKHGLSVDGVVGPQTWGKLLFSKRAAPKPSPTECSKSTLRRGSKGSCVTELQNRLARASFAVGRYGPDGDFGGGTQAAVKEFQRQYKLAADGVVGPQTWGKLVANSTAPASRLSHLHEIKGWAGTNAIVDLTDRLAYVFRDGEPLKTITIRPGGNGVYKGVPYSKSTPTSNPSRPYMVFAKVADGYSNLYEADMPYFVVFTTNIGFHYSADFAATGYGTDGKRGSHGCVNVGNLMDARWLYENIPMGSRVVVQQ